MNKQVLTERWQESESAPGAAAKSSRARVSATVLQASVERIVAGDPTGLADLYDATVGEVYAVALRILRDPHSAEEVVSEVYLQAWRTAARYDRARGPVPTWLLVICRSRALDAFRRRDGVVPHAALTLFDSAPAQEPNGQDLLEISLMGSTIRNAICLLKPVQRQIVSLAFFHDLTHSDIAAHLGMPLGTVKTLMRNALLQLRRSLEDDRK